MEAQTQQKSITEKIAEALNSDKGEIEIGKELCRTFFKNDDGNPFELTDGQTEIFMAILLKRTNRVQVITYTQYGKSETVAMAMDLRSIAFNEEWTIVAGQQDKADIIMGKCIKHLFDHEMLEEQIDLTGIKTVELLKHSRSQEKVTWRDGGFIKALTASANNRKRIKEAVTGQGARNIVQDEASLIPDDLQAMIVRMLGGFKDSFLLKIGNPFYRNHFKKTWESSNYKKIFIDYKQGLAEGRVSREFIEEARPLPFFDILYESKFPSSDEVLKGGYRQLISDELLENALITPEEFKRDYCKRKIKDDEDNVLRTVPDGQPRYGGDFAGGGNDRSAYVIRWPKVMKFIESNRIKDTMQQVPIVERHIEEYRIEDKDVGLDYGGLGQGIGDRLHEKDIFTNNIMFGQSAPDTDKQKFKNMRAFMYYELFVWLQNGGKIVKDDGFYELLVVNYKEDSEKKFQIQPKEELKKIMKEVGLTVTSPDIADAAALTFADNSELIDEDDVEMI